MGRLKPAERLAALHRDVTLEEIAKSSAWDQHVVENAVFLYGLDHETFSANDIRPLLPEMGRGFLGAAINSLRMGGVIARVSGDGKPSTSPPTHGHRLAVWMLTARGHRIAAQRFYGTAAARRAAA